MRYTSTMRTDAPSVCFAAIALCLASLGNHACGADDHLLTATDVPQQVPHIVLFISDDHGFSDSPVFDSATHVRTPHMQRLAAQGTVFTTVFAASPSRGPNLAVLHTGLFPSRNGSRVEGSPIRFGVRTLPSYLSELGYRVIQFGGSDPERNVRHWLEDEVGAGQMPLCLLIHSQRAERGDVSEEQSAEGLALAPTLIDTPATRRARAAYDNHIAAVDRQLGEAFDAVRAALPHRETLFIYTSTNGAPLPGGKWNLYDAGIRVPMIAVWPGNLAPNSRNDAIISFSDFLPTLVEVAGGTPPSDVDGHSFASTLRGESHEHRDLVFASHTADGDFHQYPMRAARDQRFKYIRNLFPECRYTSRIDQGGSWEFWKEWLSAAESSPDAAEIVGRYHHRDAEELYDLQSDPLEQRNLARDPAYAEHLLELREQVDLWMQRQEDAGAGGIADCHGGQGSHASGPRDVIFVPAADSDGHPRPGARLRQALFGLWKRVPGTGRYETR